MCSGQSPGAGWLAIWSRNALARFSQSLHGWAELPVDGGMIARLVWKHAAPVLHTQECQGSAPGISALVIGSLALCQHASLKVTSPSVFTCQPLSPTRLSPLLMWTTFPYACILLVAPSASGSHGADIIFAGCFVLLNEVCKEAASIMPTADMQY